MASRIHAAEYSLAKVFSEDFSYSIPDYQRPYAWTTEETGELLDDLLAAVGEDSEGVEEREPYFLGSIVLVKEEDSPNSEVIDGQQRLTTLSILFSCLRHLLPAHASELGEYLWEKGSQIAGRPDRYRIQIRERDQDFFRQGIQEPGGIDWLASLTNAVLSDSQRNIRDNALLLRDRLSALEDKTIVDLAGFMVRRCFLVVVATSDLDSAFRIFSVLNDRGLPLTNADILKADIIGKINPSKRESYSIKWEDTEEDLGRDAFQELFSHIRMIFRKEKLRATVLKEVRQSVLPKYSPDEFIDKIIIPYSDAFQDIQARTFESTSKSDEINELLLWLSRIDNFDWIPPAILFLSINRDQPDQVLAFLADLERLAASMMVQRTSINDRVSRYARLLGAIQDGVDLFAEGSPLGLSVGEKTGFLRELNGNVYLRTKARQYVLLRLDQELSGGSAKYDYSVITVEHVLPQNPGSDSDWLDWFDDDEHGQWVHRLANLVLLTRRKNSAAQNYDFDHKKSSYFTTKNGVSPFVLTTQVLREFLWTPSVLDARQDALIARLQSIWRL